MTVDPAPSGVRGNYAFYDENYRPIWKRGISRKIGESAFVQQTLPTYRLSWSPLAISPGLLLLGALFTGMGVGIMRFSNGIQEIRIPYTNCSSNERSGWTCYQVLESATNNLTKANGQIPIFNVDANEIENCTCNVPFELKEPLGRKVYMHYSLTNFYQNHRDYFLSRDVYQLKGSLFNKDGEPKKPMSTCDPMDYDNLSRVIYPCGLMANSMFTDVIHLAYLPETDLEIIKLRKNRERSLSASQEEMYRNEDERKIPVPLIKTGIAWDSDRHDKYDYPEEFLDEKNPIWEKFAKPYGWKKTLWDLDRDNASNNGVLNEDFIVWMRTAAFPWFRKLYRIVDTQSEPFEDGLPAGNYELSIKYNYDVSSFNGQKDIILTTTSMVAGKNMFLAIVYMSTGSFFMLLAILLFAIYHFHGKSKLVLNSVKKD